MRQTSNLNVESMTPLEPPDAFLLRFPMTDAMSELVADSREQIRRIINGENDRMLVLVGPCSIHDEKAGLEYARRLAELKKRVEDRIMIVMRVYFEKPRTTIGWKGFINDPHLNGSFDVPTGLTRARKFLLDVLDTGLPAGIEWLDPVTPQYLADLMSWGAIGARTVESQTHRQLASGLSTPIGFKNGTGGTGHSIQIAVDAIVAARAPHTFLGVDTAGRVSVIKTTGNPDAHVVLRGGVQGTNYDAGHVADAVARLKKAGLPPYLMVDCSHGNSNKDYRNQQVVFRNVLEQRVSGNRHLVALMIESHLNEGNQKHDNGDPSKLKYGVSITDACVGWERTEELLLEAHSRLRAMEPVSV
ncbi:MAG: 3-deoxy-7-phosphoheptulonate synthase [Candidatus Wildermuthbacteria bacterium RIFCSPHIGHO2_01_FULL_48_25]|uniref:Phospho-2-dehydro-3-deoxyheptonate aldolase n=1 Tax=Candidatus Wildermuthbacteria bacterium RIFCSPLOWO2_01_FULL_48_16 TaxID=1802461 RepID=A0A1G2RL65_9BACT|nr:MAG: 3-deoxy-7-phosphoheptulonate synthase [Candidatus Wildermuthbacteria bacterium RIFCSPHIGHO2_01_FULL_48_25]OHA73022.1 MAG: 3-deoxy-7-phosphoheptulonate synthase [Candidatus Wildermuthbacteria bacterium RIFCSPLOWO2_01_FULL_48_16]